jgi:hypothetical protein
MGHLHRAGKVWIRISDRDGGDMHAPGGEYAKLRHWELIERKGREHGDGGGGCGYWRITERGWLFLEGRILIRNTVHEYAGGLLTGKDAGGDAPEVSVGDIKPGFRIADVLPRDGAEARGSARSRALKAMSGTRNVLAPDQGMDGRDDGR